MEKRRVLLVCSEHLFGESVEAVLHAAEDVELVGPWKLGEDVCQRIEESRPSVVVIADEQGQDAAVTRLTAEILQHHPELPVIRARLDENVFRVFSTHTLPAQGKNLLEAIRGCVSSAQATDKSHSM